MEHFKDKSLCVLNQKDKFTPEQVETTTKYVSEKFDKYFSQKLLQFLQKWHLDSRDTLVKISINSRYSVDGTFTKEFKKAFK